mgnify:CR=1 FL=1
MAPEEFYVWRGVPLGPISHNIWGKDYAVGIDRASPLARQLVQLKDYRETIGRDMQHMDLMPVSTWSLEKWLEQGLIYVAPGVVRKAPRPARGSLRWHRQRRCGYGGEAWMGDCEVCSSPICSHCLYTSVQGMAICEHCFDEEQRAGC